MNTLTRELTCTVCRSPKPAELVIPVNMAGTVVETCRPCIDELAGRLDATAATCGRCAQLSRVLGLAVSMHEGDLPRRPIPLPIGAHRSNCALSAL